MKTIEKSTSNFTKKNLISVAGSSYGFLAIPKEGVDIKAAAIIKDDGENGTRYIAAVVDMDNHIYSGISETMVGCVDSIVDLIDDGETCHLIVESRESKSGRTYCSPIVI